MGGLATTLQGGFLVSVLFMDTGCARQLEAAASAATELSTGCEELRACAAACNAGDAEGCLHAGYRYEVGVEVPRRIRRAEGFYAAGCAGGNPAACVGEGRVAEAIGDPDSVARAAARFDQACQAGLGEACLRAALLAGLVARHLVPRHRRHPLHGIELCRQGGNNGRDDGVLVWGCWGHGDPGRPQTIARTRARGAALGFLRAARGPTEPLG